MSRCRAKTADGKRCKANARAKRRHCFFHDPKSAESRAAAQANGGAESRNRVGPSKTLGKDAAEVGISGEQEVLGVLTETINQVRRGQMAPNVGHVVGQLLGVGLKALKQDEQDKKIAELDQRTRPLMGLTTEQLLEIVRAGRGAPPTTADGASPH
jgi:hypothetical protein